MTSLVAVDLGGSKVVLPSVCSCGLVWVCGRCYVTHMRRDHGRVVVRPSDAPENVYQHALDDFAPVPAQQVTVTASASSWAGGWNPDALDDSPPADDEAVRP